MVTGTSYTRHSQLFSNKNLWNERITKEPKSNETKILEPSAFQNSQILVFGSKRANLATLLQLQ